MFSNIETKDFSFYIPIRRGEYIIFLPISGGWMVFEEGRRRIVTHEIKSTCFLTVKIVNGVIKQKTVGLKGSKLHVISPGVNGLIGVRITHKLGSLYLFGGREKLREMKRCSFSAI